MAHPIMRRLPCRIPRLTAHHRHFCIRPLECLIFGWGIDSTTSVASKSHDWTPSSLKFESADGPRPSVLRPSLLRVSTGNRKISTKIVLVCGHNADC